ncbi:unnamed protein product [Dovyalis caffra]|uniref:Sulfotransferase n=1 Tax=Dovyalis caffra TaxID=77055 RepID=A0AAV1RID8_9ROSI|nr:unnamed protein product [Dovyalis caffra]
MGSATIVLSRGAVPYSNSIIEARGKTRNKNKYTNLWNGRFLGISLPCHGKRNMPCRLYTSTGETKPTNDLQELLLTLPSEKNWDGSSLHLYGGVWYPAYAISGVVSFQQHFIAQNSDIILASMPASGMPWLKALAFSVINRNHQSPKESPLLFTSPHELVRSLENDLYFKTNHPNLEQLPLPRIFSTHAHYSSLPLSIIDSKCKIVFICRNPLDQAISYFLFASKSRQENDKPGSSIEEHFEKICRGVQNYGPFWDSSLGYWKESLERPEKVLFLRYEDLKDNTISNLKKLAEFLGFPFSENEEKERVLEEILSLCSFDNLKDLKVNKNGVRPNGVPNSVFFRSEEVGHWSNYLSPQMAENFRKTAEERLVGSGLAFKISQ